MVVPTLTARDQGTSKMNLFLIAALLGPVAQAQPKPVVIGTHYTDVLAGLVVYRSAKNSVLLDFGWKGPDGVPRKGYKALVEAKVHFGAAAPDDSYHRISWLVGLTTVSYEWGLAGKDGAVGRLSATGPVEISPTIGPAWPGSKPKMFPIANTYTQQAGDLKVEFRPIGKSIPLMSGFGKTLYAYEVDASHPLLFSIGAGALVDPKKAGTILDAARKKYQAGRLWAEGDWGDFLSPIENQLGNTKIYSSESGRLAHIVSRGWCLPDGQVLFCWDSFFNGLLSSLEDPKMARNTVRAIIAEAPPAGFVPNFGGRGWGVSVDRSQPPVGSYCVWKMNQRDPDPAFLKDVYPKLLKWHNWWFAKQGPGKRPNRDGNGDGLLEWGSGTGDLQNAKFESGLDDSPMFDDGKMSGPNMTMDATDLNALWAMDAEYLARIADRIGKKSEATRLRKECAAMARRMDDLLWDDARGVYGYRYWTPKQATQDFVLTDVFKANGKPGLKGEYFQGRDLAGEAKVRQDTVINFNWSTGPMEGFGQKDFSIRWTADFVPPKSGPYVFEAASDDGCRIWLDGKKIVDGWSVHPSTKFESTPITLKAGDAHKFRMEYFQADGGAEVSLAVHRIVSEKPGVKFSPRLSPLNYYPLIVDAPSKQRARRALDLFFRPDQFGGKYVCPTISKSDSAYPLQGYWRGTVWGPTSYLTYQGLRRYATGSEMIDYAEKSVALFMKNWNADGSCHENFNSITGWGRSDPHYTWGALLCLVGMEQLCDTDADGRVLLNGNSGRHIKVHNLRIGGRLYDVVVEPQKAVLLQNGKPVAVARGKVAAIRL